MSFNKKRKRAIRSLIERERKKTEYYTQDLVYRAPKYKYKTVGNLQFLVSIDENGEEINKPNVFSY